MRKIDDVGLELYDVIFSSESTRFYINNTMQLICKFIVVSMLKKEVVYKIQILRKLCAVFARFRDLSTRPQ